MNRLKKQKDLAISTIFLMNLMHKQQKLQIWYSVVHQHSRTCPLPALGGVPVWSTAGANSFCNVSVAEKQRREIPSK